MAKNSVPTPERKGEGEQKKLNIASTIILAVIVVTFIAAPTVTGFLSQGAVSFGSYGGRSIDHTGDNFFGERVKTIAQGQSTEVPAESVWRQAFEDAAFQTAIMVEAEEAGVLISTPLVDHNLRVNGPYLQDGEFSPALYNETPDAAKAEYRKDFTENLLQSEWIQTQVYGPKLPDATITFIQNMAYPQRKFNYVAFTEADYPDTEAAAWGRDNAKLFQSMVLSRITVTSSAQDAAAVLAEVEKGERTFENLAQAYSKDSYAQQGGSMGRVRFHELQADFSNPTELEALFQLPQGRVSPVYATPLGYAIYRVQEAATQADFSQADTVQAAKQYLLSNERGIVDEYLKTLAQNFRAQAEAGSLEAAARSLGKTVQETGFVAINFGNHELLPSIVSAGGQDLGGLSNSEEFYKEAFSLSGNKLSQPILGDRRYLVLRLNEEKTGPDADAIPPDYMAEQYRSMLVSKRLQNYQDMLLGSYKFKDNFEEGFRQRMQTFQQ